MCMKLAILRAIHGFIQLTLKNALGKELIFS